MNGIETNSLFEAAQEQKPTGGHIIRVAFETAVDNEFDYLVPDKFWPVRTGQRVEVPFGRANKLEKGFCVESDIPLKKSFAGRSTKRALKKVVNVVSKTVLVNTDSMGLARWLSSYYVCPLGQVLTAMVPAAVKRNAGVRREKRIYLTAAKKKTEQLRGKKQKRIVECLMQNRAVNADSAISMKKLTRQAECIAATVNRLAEKLSVKIIKKVVMRALPAVPEKLNLKPDRINLNDDQKRTIAHIRKCIDSEKFGVTLLHGVTDSGKTEIYIRVIEYCIGKKAGTAIVLLPEIALTAQTVQRFNEKFKKVAVMHSGLTAAQRNAQWQKIKAGQADVVIGARSAVFAPLDNIRIIIVDEEHEPSYKQDTAPRYNGRDVAIKRAQLAKAHCILGSATPSLETFFNCQNKKHFTLMSLPKRVMNLPMPEMKLVDLRNERSASKGVKLLSAVLDEALKKTLARGEQAILLLNRRGYSNFVFCPSCRHILQCQNCDVTLTFHKSPDINRMRTVTGKHIGYGYAVCHYCGARTLVPEKCPLCGKALTMIGTGSQRLEEELAQKFPSARIARIDSDSMEGKNYYQLLKDFSEGRIDILAGTQILAKGLHFPNVTLVGIISADTCLWLPDFRTNERTFQLISHVAGRTGRSDKKGTVFVQTFLAEHPAIRFAMKNDYSGFVSEELKHRRACNLPPFWRLAVITMRDTKFDKLRQASETIRERIDFIVKRYHLNVIVRGPVPAPISRLHRFHRMQIVVQGSDPTVIRKVFAALRVDKPVRPAVKIAVDIDPVNLL